VAKIQFFDVFTGLPVREFEATIATPKAVTNLDYSAGLLGSLAGNGLISVDPASESFLKSLKENSHFLKVYRDGFTPYGAIVEAGVINRGVCTVSFIGLDELFGKVDLTVAHKANAIGENTTIRKDDPSWGAQFYSDSPLGVFEAVINEFNETMIARGQRPFIKIDGILDFIETLPAESFARNYRLNALEFPTLKSVVDSIFEDSEMSAITVELEPGDTFGWVLGVLTSYTTVVVNVADKVRNITFEDSGDVSRSYSLATGTNLSGDTVVSKIAFDPTVAYSSFIANNPADRTTAIDRINRSALADADKRKQQVSFTVFDTRIKIQNVVELSGGTFPLTKIVITQIVVKGRDVTYTGQAVTDAAQIVKGISKPMDEARRLVYGPLRYAGSTAKEVAFKKDGSTGWRS
jgi:hypothetical protein